MKKTWIFAALMLAFLISAGQSLNAQEEKKEKKVKIVTVDENGNKVVIDTIVTDLKELEYLELGEGKSFGIITAKAKSNINDEDEEITWTIVTSDGDSLMSEKTFNILKGDDANYYFKKGKSEDGAVVMSISKSKEKGANYVIISADDEKEIHWHSDKDDLEGDEKHIIIRSAEGEDVFKIKGDATITIKDGKISVVNGKPGEKKIVKETEKTVTKKKN